MIVALLLALPAGAAGAGGGQVQSRAAQQCKQERTISGKRAFHKKYGAKHAMRACIKRKRPRVASTIDPATEQCQGELAQSGLAEFLDEYLDEDLGTLDQARANASRSRSTNSSIRRTTSTTGSTTSSSGSLADLSHTLIAPVAPRVTSRPAVFWSDGTDRTDGSNRLLRAHTRSTSACELRQQSSRNSSGADISCSSPSGLTGAMT